MHPLNSFRLARDSGSLQEEDDYCMKPHREMRHHLPTPEQNNHYRVNENERFAEKTYHSRSSFQSDPRKPSGSIMEPTGFDNHGFDDVSLSSRCGKASKPEGLRTGSKRVIGTEIGALQAASLRDLFRSIFRY